MKKLITILIIILSFSCSKEDQLETPPTKRCGIVFNKPGDTGTGCSNTTTNINYIIGVSFNNVGESLCVDEQTFNSLEIGGVYCENL